MALFKVIGNSAKIKKALNACKKFNPEKWHYLK